MKGNENFEYFEKEKSTGEHGAKSKINKAEVTDRDEVHVNHHARSLAFIPSTKTSLESFILIHCFKVTYFGHRVNNGL